MDNTLSLFCSGKGKVDKDGIEKKRVLEDALPIIDERFLLVADGLGGSGGSAHTTVVSEVMDSETCFNALFNDVLNVSEDSRKIINEYFNESLADYFALDEDAKKDRSCEYKSGYFASRIVATILYSYFLDKDKEWSTRTLENFASLNEEERQQQEKVIGKHYAQIINEALHKVAANGNFVQESKIVSSLKILLPTTLSAVLYKEYESYVDALFIWAGDSRGYVWTKEGLLQINNDHEKDGVMYNLINASSDFFVSAKYVRIPKPCLLFVTSDGCYSCLPSPLNFEYSFFDKMANANSYEEAAKSLEELYTSSSEDDANTVALKAFGYENYGELKEDVVYRMNNLRDKYQNALPGIFSENYARTLIKIRKVLRASLAKTDISKENGILEKIGQILNVEIDPDAWKKPLYVKITEARKALSGIIRKNYIVVLYCLSKATDVCGYKFDDYESKIIRKYHKTIEKLIDNKVEYQSTLNSCKEHLAARVEEISKVLDNLADYKFSVLKTEQCTMARNYFDYVLSLIDEIQYDKNPQLKECKRLLEKLYSHSEKCADNASKSVDEIVIKLIDKSISPDVLSEIYSGDEIRNHIDTIDSCTKKLEEDHDKGAEESLKQAQEYWRKHHIDIVSDIYISSPDSAALAFLSTDILAQVSEYCNLLQTIKLRDSLYKEYGTFYYSMQGE